MQDSRVKRICKVKWSLLLICLIYYASTEVISIQATQSYNVHSRQNNQNRYVAIHCGMKCNLDRHCQRFHIDHDQKDPCILNSEQAEKITPGEEEYVKQEEGNPVICVVYPSVTDGNFCWRSLVEEHLYKSLMYKWISCTIF